MLDLTGTGETAGLPDLDGESVKCHRCGYTASLEEAVLGSCQVDKDVLLFAWHPRCWKDQQAMDAKESHSGQFDLHDRDEWVRLHGARPILNS